MAKEEKVKEENGADPAFSTNQWIIVGFLFVLFFILLKALNVASGMVNSIPFLNVWLSLFFTVPDPLYSPMFFVMPIAGFFFIFFIIDWANRYFNTKHALNPIFILLFFFLCFFAFYVALFWYNNNYAEMANQKLLICVSDNIGGPFATCNDITNSLIEQGKFNEFMIVDFWQRLHGNAFMLFAWAGVFGWVTRFAIGKIKL